MPSRTGPRTTTLSSTAPTTTAARATGPTTTAPRATAPRTPPAADPALDEALERISDLAARLWAVRSAHAPVAAGWRRRETRCAACGQPVPCPTLRATG